MPDSPWGEWKLYPLPKIEFGQWNDMVYHIRFFPGADGRVEVWMKGARVVSYKGPTAFKGGDKRIYNKIGLYRDRWEQPMTIYFDNYTVGDGFEAVNPARFDRKP